MATTTPKKKKLNQWGFSTYSALKSILCSLPAFWKGLWTVIAMSFSESTTESEALKNLLQCSPMKSPSELLTYGARLI